MFKDMKKFITDSYGQETADKIWKRGDEIVKTYPERFPQISYKLAGQYVFPLAAIYSAFLEAGYDKEEVIQFFLNYGSWFGEKMRKMIYRITSVPGVSALIWKNIDKIMHMAGGEKMGYESEFLPVTKTHAGMNVLKCPLHEALKTMGMPEITLTICAMDKVYMNGMRGIGYRRTMSVAEGNQYCDYRLSRVRRK